MLAGKFLSAALKQLQFVPARNRSFKKIMRKITEDGFVPFSADDYAYNHIEQKMGLLKPLHTVEEQMAYMESEAYQNVYKDRPIWETYKRNLVATSHKWQPPTRLFCIDRNGRFNLNHACPMCRDEYFFFHYKNPKLMQHFLESGSDRPISTLKTGLCQEQQINLQAEVLKAKEHGTMPFNVEFRYFDYSEWYPELSKPKKAFNEADLPARRVTVEDVYPNPDICFEPHNRDYNASWDEWWVRHEKFARKAR